MSQDSRVPSYPPMDLSCVQGHSKRRCVRLKRNARVRTGYETRHSRVASNGAGLLAVGSQAKMLSISAAMDDFRLQPRQGDCGL